MTAVGPLGRLGGLMARNARLVFAAWALIAVVLGMFAPRARSRRASIPSRQWP